MGQSFKSLKGILMLMTLIVLLMINQNPANAAVLFSDDFEDGNYSG